jgi:predicted nuclease of restriction endonuclease-like RecB superfamily
MRWHGPGGPSRRTVGNEETDQMAFPLRDVRYVSRRAATQPAALHPRLIRDRAMLPKIDIAIQYFESMVGHERRELDTEVLVHFFGDHKLARCMVAALARSYRFRARTIGELVSGSTARYLRKLELDSPRALRLRLYDHLNDFGHGFLSLVGRHQALGGLESEIRLGDGALERLLYLDAPEHAILSRVGAEPEAADVAAQYNLGVLVTLLRHAESIQLELGEAAQRIEGPARAVGSANGVEVRLAGRGARTLVALEGRQDSMGSWVRYGRRIARTVLELVERARPSAIDGRADLQVRGRQVRLRLTPEILDLLGGVPAPSAGWDEWGSESYGGVLTEAAQALRGAQRNWSVRRQPDPQAWRGGLLLPDLLVRSGEERFYLYAVRSAAHAERLRSISSAAMSGEPYVFVGETGAVAPLIEAGARVIPVLRFEKAAVAEALRGRLLPPSAPRQSRRAA